MAAGEGIETMLSLRQACRHADGGRALGRTSRRHPVPRRRCAGSISPATTIRPVTARGDSLVERANEAGIEAIRAVADGWGLQRGSPHISASMPLRAAAPGAARPEDVAASWLLAA
jgi:hypothetical protein